MQEIIGACRYCGQTRLIQLAAEDIEDPGAAADEIATSECTCRSAREAAGEIARRKRIRESIMNIFQNEPEQGDFVLEAARSAMNGVIGKCSIDIGDIKYSFYMKGEKLIFARKKILNHREEF